MAKRKKDSTKGVQGTPSTSYREIKDPFGVLDALGGAPSGNYKKDLKEVQERYNSTFTEAVYEDAYQMHCQP